MKGQMIGNKAGNEEIGMIIAGLTAHCDLAARLGRCGLDEFWLELVFEKL